MENISVRTSLLQWACPLSLCLMLLMFQLQHKLKFSQRILYRKSLSKDSGAAPVYSSLPIKSKLLTSRLYFTKLIIICMSLCSARLNIYFPVLLKFLVSKLFIRCHLFFWFLFLLLLLPPTCFVDFLINLQRPLAALWQTRTSPSSLVTMTPLFVPPPLTSLASLWSNQSSGHFTQLWGEERRGVYLELLVISSPVWNDSLTFWLRALWGTLQWMPHFLSKWIVAVIGSAGLGVSLQLAASFNKQFSLGD